MHMTKDKIQYLTAKLQEEAAEVIQAVSKINRFGPQNSHPDRTTTNLQELVGELEDFLAIVAALEHYQYIDLTLSRSNIANKAKALLQG
jgi:NTP pyrophosphatase (non-canonical NTP hydrolase)